MKSTFEADYKALHAAALTLSTKLIGAMPQAEIDSLEYGIRHGGTLSMQLGPLPGCKLVELVLVERETHKRHIICKLGAQ